MVAIIKIQQYHQVAYQHQKHRLPPHYQNEHWNSITAYSKCKQTTRKEAWRSGAILETTMPCCKWHDGAWERGWSQFRFRKNHHNTLQRKFIIKENIDKFTHLINWMKNWELRIVKMKKWQLQRNYLQTT